MWGSLGDVAFEVSYEHVNSIGEAAFEHQYRYAEHQIVMGKSKLQWIGKELTKATLKGVLSDAFCKPKKEIEKLKKEASKNEPLVFVIGDEIIGLFVIERIKETYKEVSSKGDVRLIEFEAHLKEYY